MKNIITTAALLAAGTFALNAETTLVASFDSFTSLTQQSKEGNNTLKTAASGTYNPTLNANGTITFNNGGNVLYLASSSGNLGSAFGSAGISVTMTVSNLSLVSGKTNALFTFHTNASSYNSNIEGVALTSDNNLKGIWNGSVWSNSSNTPVSIAGKDKFTLTFTQTSTTTKLYIDGAHAATWNGLGFSNAAQITQYNIGNTSAGNQGTTMTLHNLYFHSGALDDAGVSSFYNTRVIPEPSSFGLLAGLGALALVGARRRRKTK